MVWVHGGPPPRGRVCVVFVRLPAPPSTSWLSHVGGVGWVRLFFAMWLPLLVLSFHPRTI